MKNHNTPQLKITDFDFVVTPHQIKLRDLDDGLYELDLQKGVQVLYKFKEQPIMKSKQTHYRFISMESCTFKLQNQNNCNLSWSLYLLRQSTAELIATCPFCDLLHWYSQYLSGLKKQGDYFGRLKQTNQRITKQWATVKKSIPFLFSGLKSINQSGSIQVCYNIEVRCELDNLCQQQTYLKKQPILSTPVRKKSLQYPQVVIHQKQEESNPCMTLHPMSREQLPYQLNDPFKSHQLQQQYGFQQFKVPSSALSDIVQTSNECSSNMNYGQRCNKLKQVDGIPQQQNEMSPSFIGTIKTHNFQSSNGADSHKRRSQTLNSNYSDQLQKEKYQLRNNIQGTENHLDSELEKEELYDADVHSKLQLTLRMRNRPVESAVVAKKHAWLKIMYILVLCIVFFSCLSVIANSLSFVSFKQKSKKGQNQQKRSVLKKKKSFFRHK